MLKKTMRPALSVLLAFIMIFSLCGTVLAGVVHGDHEHGSVINYVSIGDSMTNGYGFEGYEQTSNDRTVYDFVNGKGVYGVGSYALQFEEYLKNIEIKDENDGGNPSTTMVSNTLVVEV